MKNTLAKLESDPRVAVKVLHVPYKSTQELDGLNEP
jgi:hypothetical protein